MSSAVSTIYRLFVHHPTEAQYAVIEKFSRCLSYILAIQFIAGSFLSKTKWKKVLSLSAIILIIPDFSYSYCIASYLPAIMMYIAETKRKKSDLLYLIPFICLTVPYGINLYDYFFKVFEVGTRYSVVCQNLAQVVIFVVLFIEIVIMEINYNKNDKITVLYLKRRKGKNSEKTFILNRLTVNKIGFGINTTVIILMKDKKTDLNKKLRSVFFIR